MKPRVANIAVATPGGDLYQTVYVVGRTPLHYRIRAITETTLPRRKLRPGQTALVPILSVRFTGY